MAMGKKLSKADGARCRRHGRQGAPGVCPLCLRERLSRLSPSATLPSVVAREASSCCSGSDSDSSTEASSSASGSASPGFHREIRRAARPSLLMRHERVVAVDGDEVVLVMRRRRERPATSFWAKLLRAATGGKKKAVDGCSLAHSRAIEAAGGTGAAATKWIVF
ncbi:hypothetical protein ZWY2020_022599 [Hordeum vulgare]|nr:hypothetical protein ZWY2020_022599 [Hordeum vulgare]